jgi:hypothetical protein
MLLQADKLHWCPPEVASPVSDNVLRFIRERLPSAEQIDIVLLLRKDSSRAWSAPEVASHLGTPPESTAMRLFLLASNGILTFESAGLPRYRYAAMEPESEAMIGEIAEAWDQHRDELTEAFGGTPSADPLRSFSDAFKLKK